MCGSDLGVIALAVAECAVRASGRPSSGTIVVFFDDSMSARFGSSIGRVYEVSPDNVASWILPRKPRVPGARGALIDYGILGRGCFGLTRSSSLKPCEVSRVTICGLD